MNIEQTKLVEENHGLIFSFLKKYNLPVDDYYGVAAVALCEAAMTYNTSKYSFSTYSYRCMYNAIVNEKKAEKVKKRGGDVTFVSLSDTTFVGESGKEFMREQQIRGHESTEGIAITNIITEQMLKELEGNRPNILELRIDGYNQSEIAKILGVSRQNVSNLLSSIRKKYLKKYSHNGDTI